MGGHHEQYPFIESKRFGFYIELMKFGHHNYEWDRYYLENVSIDRLKTILSNHTDYWNIFGAFEDDELVATCTLKQMNYVGKCHKAILENNFVKIMMKLLTEN